MNVWIGFRATNSRNEKRVLIIIMNTKKKIDTSIHRWIPVIFKLSTSILCLSFIGDMWNFFCVVLVWLFDSGHIPSHVVCSPSPSLIVVVMCPGHWCFVQCECMLFCSINGWDFFLFYFNLLKLKCWETKTFYIVFYAPLSFIPMAVFAVSNCSF